MAEDAADADYGVDDDDGDDDDNHDDDVHLPRYLILKGELASNNSKWVFLLLTSLRRRINMMWNTITKAKTTKMDVKQHERRRIDGSKPEQPESFWSFPHPQMCHSASVTRFR